MFKTEKDFGGYWIKNLKNFKGHEGEPLFQCSVYKDGKRIGFFSEDSWGGPAQLQDFKQKDEDALCDYAKSVDSKPWGESYHKFIAQIADAVDEIKWFKRQCRKKTLFYIGKKLMEIRHPFCAPVEKALKDRHGEVLIVNKILA
jgi:hypothetical protein